MQQEEEKTRRAREVRAGSSNIGGERDRGRDERGESRREGRWR